MSLTLDARCSGQVEAKSKTQQDASTKTEEKKIPQTVKLGDQELKLVFQEDFENGVDRWETTDAKSWHNDKSGDSKVFGLNKRTSDYKPKYRSPLNIALIKEVELEDFVLMFDVKSTKDTGNHRDCCIFFGYQDASNFYYAHLGAKPDPASGQIMIVKNAPRTPLTKNEKQVGWTGKWQKVKVTRDSNSGQIHIYFDDMKKPQMSVVDKTFGKGRIGIGSFDDMNDFDNVRLYGK